MTDNKELKKYFDILCNGDYPFFIDKYFNTIELKRLKNIGQFCGCDYNKLYNIKYWYSRFDHSVATALITWNFTKDKVQTLAALFHDLGTPAFSHCIDFMLGDSVNQETSEKSVKEIILSSLDISNILTSEGLSIEDVCDVSQYPIIENKSPRLCADRLEGVLHTVHIWLNIWSLEQIKKVYQRIEILPNEDNFLEIGFKDIKSGELFFKGIYEYSIALQNNEDKFTTKYIADILKKQIELKKICFEDIYKLSEIDIIKLIKENEKSWNIFSEVKMIKRTNKKPEGVYYVSIESKKRYVVPLCKKGNKIVRLDIASEETGKFLSKYKDFKDSKYCYAKDISLV
jgi:HD superfamily phosphohydrolase